jgi:hypothetical protein
VKPRLDPFAPRARKARELPFEFVLEALAPLEPRTRPMFGCTAVYLDERIVFVLRKKGSEDDGVWLAYESEREADVLALFPALARISLFPDSHGWRKLSPGQPTFEEDVLRACTLLRAGDLRLGKVPASRKKPAKKSARPKRAVPRASKTKARAVPRANRTKPRAQK